MVGLDEIRERMAEYLRERGVEAVTAWEERGAQRRGETVVAVSLRACEGGPSGFRDYLGERWDEASGSWQELYGRRVRLTIGLDLYAPRGDGGGETALRHAFDAVCSALREGGPGGLRILKLSCGEPGYDRDMDLYRCGAEAVCEAYLYAVADEGGTFLDFELRGESI